MHFDHRGAGRHSFGSVNLDLVVSLGMSRSKGHGKQHTAWEEGLQARSLGVRVGEKVGFAFVFSFDHIGPLSFFRVKTDPDTASIARICAN
jgi:hypothetical protein